MALLNPLPQGGDKDNRVTTGLSQALIAFENQGLRLEQGLKREINYQPLDEVKLRQEAVTELFKITSKLNASLAVIKKGLNKRSVQLRSEVSRRDKVAGSKIGATPNKVPTGMILKDPNGREFILIDGVARYLTLDSPVILLPSQEELVSSEPIRGEDDPNPSY